MGQPVVHGPAFSTYVRSVRLALHEKGVPHQLVDVDFLGGAHKQAPHTSRHPFGRVPAFEHDGNQFYEASAILRYIDEVFPGPALMPSTPLARVKVNQVMSIIDSYGYTPCVHGLFIRQTCKRWRARRSPRRCSCRRSSDCSARRSFLAARVSLWQICTPCRS
jgi:glutathione S-transferase